MAEGRRHRVKVEGPGPAWEKRRWSLTLAIARAARQARRSKGPYDARLAGKPAKLTNVRLFRVLRFARRVLKEGPVGEMVAIVPADGPTVFIRTVQIVSSVNLPPDADRWCSDVREMFIDLSERFAGKWESWGVCNCRTMRGSGSVSSHAECASLDIAPTDDNGNHSFPRGDEINRYLEGNPPYHIEFTVWRDGGAHESHIHAQTRPNPSRFPSPCPSCPGS